MSYSIPSPRLILAPIRGITDGIYRSIAAECFGGFDAAMAPFVTTVSAANIPSAFLRDLAPEKNTALPVEPQLLGKSAADFLRMAKRLFDQGYESVNLNMGCPFPRVANKGRGSGMLPDPDGVARFLDETAARLPGRLSIKLRLGRTDAAEIINLMPVLNRFPLAALTIHPRLGTQMYDGRPDLEIFARCLEMSRHPVIYNGDINAVGDWEVLAGRFPTVAGWMIGRGALSDPFLASAIKAGPVAYPPDPADAIREFHQALLDAYQERLSGPGHLLDRMKGLWQYLSVRFADRGALLKAVQKCRRLDLYEDAVARFFDGRPQWTPLPPADWR
ncbi:MAG: tRNA-dihydrouridine synthase family protein [Pseudomonadota bacterium]